jgi:hypothetical protein
MKRARSIEKTFALARADLLGDDFRAWHAQVARSILSNHLNDLDKDDKPRVEIYVDGRHGASEDTVKLYGIIRYEFIRSAVAVKELLDWLIAEGNKVSPKYGSSFAVGVLKSDTFKQKGGRLITNQRVEGRLIPAQNFAAQSQGIPPDSTFIIVNTKSWSRKVDVQLMGLKPMIFAIPQFILERGAHWMRARHPELIVSRWYTSTFDDQYTLLRGPRRGSPVHSPCLLVGRAS